jgi:hypothetical protein
MDNTGDIPAFFDMLANTTVDKNGLKSVHVKTKGHEKVRITVMLSVLAGGRNLTPFLKIKNFQKDGSFYWNYI